MSHWDQAELVFLTRPLCPYCRHEKWISIRTLQGGDGSSSRRCICRKCSRRFILVFEPPDEPPEFLPKFGSSTFSSDRI